MEVVNARSALLSNYEVLTLLRELESDHLAKTKTALRIKKEEEASGVLSNHHPITDQICENLRTMEVEAIQYLSAEYQPIVRQNDAAIAKLVKELSPYGLTKAEKLQIVNLAPTEAVELYVIVEELEDRLGTRMEEVLELVRASLSKSQEPAAAPLPVHSVPSAEMPLKHPTEEQTEDMDRWGDVDAEGDDMVFDDFGEGAGIEGDLDMEDE